MRRRCSIECRGSTPPVETAVAAAARVQQHVRDGGRGARRRGTRNWRPSAMLQRVASLGNSESGTSFCSAPTGSTGLVKKYGLRLDGRPVSMDLGLLYRALESRQVDMAAGNCTDGQLQTSGRRSASRRQALLPAVRVRDSRSRCGVGGSRGIAGARCWNCRGRLTMRPCGV